jgi:hypothetical protein
MDSESIPAERVRRGLTQATHKEQWKMNLQRNLKAMTLVVAAAAMSAGAAVITNNVTNFNNVSNQIAGGRWSYLDVVDMNSTSTSLGTLSMQYAWSVSGSAPWNNWCVNTNKTPDNCWYVLDDGNVITDGRAVGWAYTVGNGAGDSVTIAGDFGLNFGLFNFAIYKTTDTDMNRVDMSTKQLLFSSTEPTSFNKNTTVVAGNDIVFVSNTTDYPFDKRQLNATITIVPEPAALSLLALGGLVLFRRRR